ncbi:hypothetical protein HY995_04955 [Candidatus Micrarchaeota archaeon]|nr:hypothetical protein [Candidatus Micrarchaeota archaeon]MBI5177404.1 hypothetical protein [Candidatus Micrarchaeota archaeon]
MKYSKDFKAHFSSKPAFSARDASMFLQSKGASAGYARLFLHNMAKRGELHAIARGAYTLNEEVESVGMAYSPYYYGLQEALAIHGLWEQETNPIVITPRTVRSGVRQFMGRNYLVRRIGRKMFFGFETRSYGDFWINVSDVEKTLLDFAHFREPLSKEVLAEFKRRIDQKKLSAYLKRVPKASRLMAERLLGKLKKK